MILNDGGPHATSGEIFRFGWAPKRRRWRNSVPLQARLLTRARHRYLDILASVYIYNEHDLDTDAVTDDPELFEKLCRVIVLTEMRGMRQVEILLNSPLTARAKRL